MRPHPDATPPPEITFLTQDEVRRLLAVITGKRDRALFQLAYHHGLRASEVSLLQRKAVYLLAADNCFSPKTRYNPPERFAVSKTRNQ
jgi:integrase